MNTILLKNATLHGKSKDILIKGNRIEKIVDSAAFGLTADRTVDCTGRTVIPGFVNMHTHAAMTLMRGVEEDIPLQPWLNKIWAIEAKLDEESLYWGTKLAVLEMIKTGTTAFLDMYWEPQVLACAVDEMGIRANISYVLLDAFNPAKAVIQRKECEEMFAASRGWSDRLNFSVSIHADYTVSEENMVWASKFTRDKGLLLQTHIAETEQELKDDIAKFGVTPVMHYEKLGILDENLVAAHMIWLNDEDIEVFGRHKATAVHNINSNLKLSSGYKFKAKELVDAGANVCVGTDGASSSNNLDIRETLKTVAMVQKAFRHNPAACPLAQLMDFATVNGAKAMGIESGVIREGALADLSIVNTSNEMFVPNFNFLSNLIFSANSSCIESVMCDGKFVMENRKVKDEDEIIEKANEQAWKLLKKANY